jgi:hypothetical protein
MLARYDEEVAPGRGRLAEEGDDGVVRVDDLLAAAARHDIAEAAGLVHRDGDSTSVRREPVYMSHSSRSKPPYS